MDQPKTKPWHLLLLSAKTKSALERSSSNLIRHFKKKPGLNIEDAAFTLQVGRERFNHRKMIVCRNVEDAIKSLESMSQERSFSTVEKGKNRDVVFMFSDYKDSSKNINRFRDIYKAEARFRTEVDRCLELLRSISGFDLTGIMFSDDPATNDSFVKSNKTVINYSIQFIFQYALARLWISWGVKPKSMIGFGVGEYVSAVIADVFFLEDALNLVVLRAKEDQKIKNNGSTGRQKPSTELVSAINKIKLTTSQIPFISSAMGAWIANDDVASTAYWLEHIRKPVSFNLNDNLLSKLANHILLEVGFGQQLTTEINQKCSKSIKDKLVFVGSPVNYSSRPGPQPNGLPPVAKKKQCKKNTVLPVCSTNIDDGYFALIDALGKLSLYGTLIDWKSFYYGRRPRRVPLPSYSFAQERFWLLPGKILKTVIEANSIENPVSIKGKRIPGPCFHVPVKQQAPITVNANTNGFHQRPELDTDYQAPQNDIEKRLVEICCSLLKIQTIGMEDNIIMLGADSLFTIQLSVEIAKIFSVQITPHHLFEKPNLQSLADKIKNQDRVVPASINESAMTPVNNSYDEPYHFNNRVDDSDIYEELTDKMIENMTEEEVDNMLSKVQGFNGSEV